MQRIPCPERDDWRTAAETIGFTFHTIDGARYWDERAYYAFTLNEIERRIETPTGEIEAMCLELVGRVIKDEKYLRRLKIPDAFWPLLSESWRRRRSASERPHPVIASMTRSTCSWKTTTPPVSFRAPASFSCG